MFNNITCN